jgi:hypothetical protein
VTASGFLAFLGAALFLAAPFAPAAAATSIGEVMVITGELTAQSPGAEPRKLAKGAPLFEQDRVRSGDKSFGMLLLADNTKIQVRPNTEIVLTKFNPRYGEEAQELSVVAGGLRVLTGAIGKQKPEAVKVNSRYATMGIRGTEFIVRLCGEADCVQEDYALKQHAATPSPECKDSLAGIPAGDYVVDFYGNVVVHKDGSRIDLKQNQGAYAGTGAMQCLPALPNFVVHDQYLIFPLLACNTSKSLHKQ